MTPQSNNRGETTSESGSMLHKSRVGKGEGEPMRCVSCWMKRPSAKQRDCLCVRCDACVAHNSQEHKYNCLGGAVND